MGKVVGSHTTPASSRADPGPQGRPLASQLCSTLCCQAQDMEGSAQVQKTRWKGLSRPLLVAGEGVWGGSLIPVGAEQIVSSICGASSQSTTGPSRRVSEALSAVTHGVRTHSSVGPESPGRQQQSEIYSTKQPENKPQECLLFFLCSGEIKHNCLVLGNAGIPTHGSSAEIAATAGRSQPSAQAASLRSVPWRKGVLWSG